MNPGLMDQRIQIEVGAPGKGVSGGNTTVWVPFTPLPEVWAAVKDGPGGRKDATKAGGGEYLAGAREVTIWYIADLPRRVRLIHRGRVLTVDDIRNPGERNEHLVFDCTDGQRGNS